MNRVAPPQVDAAYAALPQAPDAAYAGHPVVPTAFEADEAEDQDGEASLPTTIHLDARIRWIMFMLGGAVLLPWNVMITATPYFLSQLSEGLRATFSSYVSITFTISNFVFLAQATVTSKQVSNTVRTRLTLAILAVVVFALYLTTHFDLPSPLFAAVILSAAAVQAAAGSYLQTAVIAVASVCGPSAMQSLMSGQAAAGVAISAVQLLSAYGSVHLPSTTSPSAGVLPPTPPPIKDDTPAKSARAFFALATIYLILTAAAHAYLVRLPTYIAVLGNLSRPTTRPSSPNLRVRSESARDQITRIAKANWVYHLAVALIFTVTLAVFPPITVLVRPKNPDAHPLIFISTHFLLFNVGDFSGRLLCSFPSLLVWSGPRLLALSVARAAFIPLFFLCNIQASSSSVSTGSIPDAGFLILIMVFGLTNGWFSTLCMIAAPNVDKNPNLKGRREDVDTAATVASFCLVGGLACGSITSFAVRGLMCRCNPLVG